MLITQLGLKGLIVYLLHGPLAADQRIITSTAVFICDTQQVGYLCLMNTSLMHVD